MKLAWATDIHLDCVDNIEHSLSSLESASRSCDAVILSGDISVGPSIALHLRMLEEALEKPIYFVLGNHDYYFSDIAGTRRRVIDTCNFISYSRYLNSVPYVKLGQKAAIVGSDGWYDGFNGSLEKSSFIMNDWLKIKDFQPAIQQMPGRTNLDLPTIVKISRSICHASVLHIIKGIKAIADNVDDIVVVTHVPPFVESYRSEKYKDMDPETVIPWYTSKMMGEMLLIAAKTYPNVQFTVLSGHTHSSFEGRILPNLLAYVGKSQYGTPQIAGYIDI
jgi:Icc protein